MHILIAIALILLLGTLTDPFNLIMPTSVEMVLILSSTLLAVVYGSFILHEKAGDERETLHRMLAGRAAFLTSMAVLTLALLVQGLFGDIDPWIPGALGATIFAKLIARVWATRNN